MAIEKILFNSKTWLPKVPGKWYKCAGNNDWGYVWLWKFNSETNIMELVHKSGNPDSVDILSRDTLVKLADISQFLTGQNSAGTKGTPQQFGKIVECTARPDCVGDYVTLSDVQPVNQNGGVTSLLSHIRRCLQSLLRNEVIV